MNALMVDVEDYYHVAAFESVIRRDAWCQYESRVERNTWRILDLFDEYGTKATFFVLGCIGEQHPELVQAIAKHGHEVASHGYSHRRIYKQTPAQFREETRKAKKIVEDIIGQPIIGYRAASYSITSESLWALDILAEENFYYDSSIFPIRHDLYGIPNHYRFFSILDRKGSGTIAEIPLSTLSVFGGNVPVGGGGYLRFFPYALTDFALRRFNVREHQPAVVYFHPWEIDPDQPRIPCGWKSRVCHYTNLNSMEAKVRKLLANFKFAPIREVYASRLFRRLPLLLAMQVTFDPTNS